MVAAFLAAFLFALNATCANRSVQQSGPVVANLSRLAIAVLVLGAFSHLYGRGLASASVGWFMLSGVIGMGLGDLGVYAALPRLGSRLTVLITQCLAAPIAALGEWLWLGTRLTGAQVFWDAVILGGVAVALLPSRTSPPRVRVRPLGFVFGIVAAAGQGLGALFSRRGVTAATEAGETVAQITFGLDATYRRVLAGLVFTGVWFLLLYLIGRLPAAPARDALGRPRFSYWLLANGLVGPVAGVSCYQWALATAPSGVVLPIVATTPLLAIPITFWLEGDRPSRRSIVGGLAAVAGCIALARAS